MTYLGFDFGEKKLGLAVSDSSGTIVQPLEVLNLGDRAQALTKLTSLVKQWQVDAVVVGMPHTEAGSKRNEHIKKEVESLLTELEKSTGRKLGLLTQVEDYSTKFSNQGLSRSQKHSMGDAYAAASILQRFLDWQREHI